MISETTARRIAYAYAEITAATELLETIVAAEAEREDPDFRDAFGRRRNNLQLGVPTGTGGHRLMDVAPLLARVIIEAHLAEQRAQIAALSELARTELGGIQS